MDLETATGTVRLQIHCNSAADRAELPSSNTCQTLFRSVSKDVPPPSVHNEVNDTLQSLAAYAQSFLPADLPAAKSSQQDLAAVVPPAGAGGAGLWLWCDGERPAEAAYIQR